MTLPVPPTWAGGSGPLYRQLAEALATAIRRGELGDGAMLPPERDLAAALSVSRATVSRAYDELRARRLVDGRQGRGTWVVGAADPRPAAEHIAPLLADHPQQVDLALAVPPVRRIDVESTPRGDGSGSERVLAGPGYEPAGLSELREAIARRLDERGLATSPDQILVTSGAQHALALVVAELVEPGAVVIVEESTYPGALDLARAARARLVAVPTDERGVDVDALESLVARHRPALVYLNPTHQTPTGTVLAGDRRRRLAALAERTGTPVVDDATLADLAFDPHARPRLLAAADRRAPVVTIGSLSKVVWPGLRVGWVRADRELIERLTARRMVHDLGGSLPAQLLAVDLVADLDRRAAERAELLRQRHDHVLELLGRHLPDWEVAPAAGGTVLWPRLPAGADAEAFAARAAAHGVSVVAGPAVSVPGAAGDRLRLSFVAEPALLELGVTRLAAAWAELGSSAGRSPRRAPLV